MKHTHRIVFAFLIASLIVGCGTFRKITLDNEDHGGSVSGSMEPITLGEKYPAIPLQQVPQNEDLIKGVLDNGMTYYIFRGDGKDKNFSKFQSGSASLHLVQKTGSLVEDDLKTGVAHFVEHYAFLGTEHFPDNAAIEFMRNIGINFGNDGNAMTTWDFTEYILDNVPVANKSSNIDSCLLLLHDWACAVTFDPKHFDRERSVILEEYRLHNSMAGLKRTDAFLEGTRYGNRLPIGTDDDLSNMTIDDLKDYYNKWYQPQNQAVVVFGDVDVKQIEAKIKATFGTIPRGNSQIPHYKHTPIQHSKPNAYVFKDKTADRADFLVCFSLSADSLVRHRNTSAWYINSSVRNSCIYLLSERLRRIQQETMLIDGIMVLNLPSLVCIKDDYPIILRFNTSKDNWRTALEVVAAEIEKIKKYGWTKYECRAHFHKSDDNKLSVNLADSIDFKKGERQNQFIDFLRPQLLTFNFVYGEPMFNEEFFGIMDYHSSNGVSPSMAHDYYCRITADSNTTILLTLPENAEQPTEDDVVESYLKVRDIDLEPSKYQYAENKNFFDFLGTLPSDMTPGKVVSSKKSELDGCTELTLSNGVKVVVTNVGSMRRCFDIEVLRLGEFNYFNDDEVKKIKLLPRLVANKFAEMNSNNATVRAMMSISGDNNDELLYLSIGNLSAESLFKYIRYTLTDSPIDSLRFAAMKQNLISDAEKDANPLDDMKFEWNKAVYGDGFSNRQGNLTKQQLERLTLREMQELYKAYTSNYNGALIMIKTDYPVKTIQPLIEKYFGSLPSIPSKSRQRKFGGFEVARSNDSLYYKSPAQMPRADLFMGYVLDSATPYSQEREILHDAFISCLKGLLYDRIRLDDGNIYAFDSEYYIPNFDWHGEYVRVNSVCAPSYAATLQQKIDLIIHQMAYGDLITPQMVNNYVNGKVAKLPGKVKDSEYVSFMSNYYKNQCTDRRITDEKLLRALTVDKIKALAREYLEKGFKKQVVISTDI